MVTRVKEGRDGEGGAGPWAVEVAAVVMGGGAPRSAATQVRVMGKAASCGGGRGGGWRVFRSV